MHASSFHSAQVAHKMYVKVTYTRLKLALHFISRMIVVISVQDDGAVDVL